MKEIPLTQGKVALVNDEDFEKLNQFKWCVYRYGHLFYAGRAKSVGRRKQTTIRMHHEIIGKPSKGFETDHEDGNGLNNQRYNLRHVTHRQNCQNYKNIVKTSRYPGVCWYKEGKKWRATIKINGKQKSLGYFMLETDAFAAYRIAVEDLGQIVIGNY